MSEPEYRSRAERRAHLAAQARPTDRTENPELGSTSRDDGGAPQTGTTNHNTPVTGSTGQNSGPISTTSGGSGVGGSSPSASSSEQPPAKRGPKISGKVLGAIAAAALVIGGLEVWHDHSSHHNSASAGQAPAAKAGASPSGTAGHSQTSHTPAAAGKSSATSTCPQAAVQVAVSPDIAPGLKDALISASVRSGSCSIKFAVTPVTTTQIISAFKSDGPQQQIWISDSPTAFSEAAQAAATKFTPSQPFASTPAVISSPVAIVRNVGANVSSWPALLDLDPTVAFNDATKDAASAVAAVSLKSALPTPAMQTKVLDSLASGAKNSLPSDRAYVTSEAAIVAANGGSTNAKFDEFPLPGGSPLLQARALRLTPNDPQTDTAYTALMSFVNSSAGQKALIAHGLRDAKGASQPADAPQGAGAVNVTPLPSESDISSVTSHWKSQ